MHEDGYIFLYSIRKDEKNLKMYMLHQGNSEKRWFGGLSFQSDVSQWGGRWADVPAAPTAPSVWLTEMDNASLDLAVFFMPAIFRPVFCDSTWQKLNHTRIFTLWTRWITVDISYFIHLCSLFDTDLKVLQIRGVCLFCNGKCLHHLGDLAISCSM